MENIRFAVVLLLLITAPHLKGDIPAELVDLADGLPMMSETEYQTLAKERQVTRYYFENVPPLWLQNVELRGDLFNDIERIRTTVGVESIFLIKPSDIGWPIETDFGSDELLQTMQNTIFSISKLKDVEYYSVTRNRMRTLFTESYRISTPENTTPIADPVVDQMPAGRSLFVFQIDTTFGEQINRIEYRSKGDELSLSMTNLKPLRYGIIRVAGKEQMQIHLLLTPIDDVLLFYACIVVQTSRLFGLERTSKESFYNRIQALYSWFTTELASRAPVSK